MKKLSLQEFKDLTTIKNTDYGVFLETKTEICKYGQAYKKNDTDEPMERYLNFYYPIYLQDFELK